MTMSQRDNRLILFLAGDVMTGRGIDQALPYSVPPILYESYVKDARDYIHIAESENGNIKIPVSYVYPWGDAMEVWKEEKPDLKFINLETSITTHYEAWPRKGIHYRMHPANIELLKSAGIDHCSLANNHMLDWSRPGLEETMKTIGKAGIRFSGAGLDKINAVKPSIFYKNGIRILVFSYGAANSGIPSAWAADQSQSGINYISGFGDNEVEEVRKNILSYKKTEDLVIFSIHWGGNWGYKIPREHMDFAHHLIDEAGVDLIFGHSSHHPLGMEVYKGKLIIYGAGDFINDYEGIRGHEEYRPELSLMYFPEIAPQNGELIKLKIIPMEIRKFRLNHAKQEQIRWVREVLTREGEQFGNKVEHGDVENLFLKWK
ncbi:CapA family protein [Gramella sp. KN1008]|nr:CapA family protein [Gramella sp. KN1008]